MPTSVGEYNLAMAAERGGKSVGFHSIAGTAPDSQLVNLGAGVFVHPHQELNLAQARAHKFNSKEQGGTLTNVFSSGTKVNVDLVPQGQQAVDTIILSFDLSMSTGTAELPPAPLLINYIEIRPNKGQEHLGRIYGENIYHNFLRFDPDYVEQIRNTLGVDEDYREGFTLTTATKYVSFPFFGNWLDTGNIYMEGLFSDEVRFEIVFNANWLVSGTAANVRMTDLRLTTLHHQVDMSRKQELMNVPRSGLHIRYLDYARQIENVQLTPGSVTSIELSALTGKFAFFTVQIRDQGATPSSPFRHASSYYYPWNEISIAESGGQNMIGGSRLRWEEFSNYYFPRFFPGGPKFIKRNNFAAMYFSEDPNNDMQTASSTGHHYMKGNDRLEIVPPSGTPVNAVVAFICQNKVNAASQAPTITPDGGTWFINWKDPISRKICRSDNLDFDATAATIQNAMYAMPHFMGVVTVNEGFDADGAITFTFSGHLAATPITIENIWITSNMDDGGTVGVDVVEDTANSVAAARGFTAGTYEVLIFGYHHYHLAVDQIIGGRKTYSKHKE